MKKRLYVSPFGYAYEQPDGSWKVPIQKDNCGVKFMASISENKRVITITPLEPITPVVERVTMERYLDIYKHCLSENIEPYPFMPDKGPHELLMPSMQDLSDLSSDYLNFIRHNSFDFNPLYQNIVLLCAAMNNEL